MIGIVGRVGNGDGVIKTGVNVTLRTAVGAIGVGDTIIGNGISVETMTF